MTQSFQTALTVLHTLADDIRHKLVESNLLTRCYVSVEVNSFGQYRIHVHYVDSRSSIAGIVDIVKTYDDRLYFASATSSSMIFEVKEDETTNKK
jgi:hypothetical protein